MVSSIIRNGGQQELKCLSKYRILMPTMQGGAGRSHYVFGPMNQQWKPRIMCCQTKEGMEEHVCRLNLWRNTGRGRHRRVPHRRVPYGREPHGRVPYECVPYRRVHYGREPQGVYPKGEYLSSVPHGMYLKGEYLRGVPHGVYLKGEYLRVCSSRCVPNV